MKSACSKVNNPSLKFVALTRVRIFLLKKREEQENPPKNRGSNSRKDKIEIHHTETCKVDKSTLPVMHVSKGMTKWLLGTF